MYSYLAELFFFIWRYTSLKKKIDPLCNSYANAIIVAWTFLDFVFPHLISYISSSDATLVESHRGPGINKISNKKGISVSGAAPGGGPKLGDEATLEEAMSSLMGHCPPGFSPAGRARGTIGTTAPTRQDDPRSPVRCQRRQSYHMEPRGPSRRRCQRQTWGSVIPQSEAAQAATTCN